MVQLRQADAQALLSFLVEVGDMEFDEPYPIDFFTRLRNLVPCAAITYQVADVDARHFDLIVGIGPGDVDDDVDDGADDAHSWSLGPCPISDYRARTGSLSPIRVTDVIGSRRYHELPSTGSTSIQRALDHMIDVGLPAQRGRLRSLVLFRETGSHDFSEREPSVAELLVSPATVKKHLEHVYEKSGSRGRTAAARLAPTAYRLAD